MNRHNSNNVKMLKMAASATKQTKKLTANERKSVASIRLGKPKTEKPRCVVWRGAAVASELLARKGNIGPEESSGTRWTSRNNRLNPNMNTVANHGPMLDGRVPTRDRDSPRSESK